LRGFCRSGVLGLCALLLVAATAQASPADVEAAHRRGVELGRAGHYHEAFAILLPLLAREPGDYSIRRDVVVLYAWRGDCKSALRYFKPIAHHSVPEDYLVSAVGECLLDERRPRAARRLLGPASRRYPGNQDITHLLERARNTLASEGHPTMRLSLQSDSSDKGNIEWQARASVEQPLADRWQARVRYLAARAQDPVFATGDLNRIGVGLRHDLGATSRLGVEYSRDVVRTGEDGITWTLDATPSQNWHLGLSQESFAEDLPLRAKAVNVHARSVHGSADYHSDDWRWEGGLSAAYYEFTDGNRRSVWSISGDYATLLEARRERRILLELSHSTNTLPAASVVYFNPSSDLAMLAGYRITWLDKTKHKRHAHHLTLRAGSYGQEGYGSAAIWGIHYREELDFADRSGLGFDLGYDSRVYDGTREAGVTGSIEYFRRF
jgi:hypothetical protein